LIFLPPSQTCSWFDLDLSSKPYRSLRYHQYAVRGTAFHRSYPLFASSSDDGTAHVFHGRVYADLMTNPLIVPGEAGSTSPHEARLIEGQGARLGRGVLAGPAQQRIGAVHGGQECPSLFEKAALPAPSAVPLQPSRSRRPPGAVKILRGHEVVDYQGVLDVAFHPTQPWAFTAGADTTICLFVNP
jgi:WD40 repeat protein